MKTKTNEVNTKTSVGLRNTISSADAFSFNDAIAAPFKPSKQHGHQDYERHDGEDDVQREEIQDEAFVGAIAFDEDRDDEGGRTDEHRVDGHLEQPIQAKQPVDDECVQQVGEQEHHTDPEQYCRKRHQELFQIEMKLIADHQQNQRQRNVGEHPRSSHHGGGHRVRVEKRPSAKHRDQDPQEHGYKERGFDDMFDLILHTHPFSAGLIAADFIQKGREHDEDEQQIADIEDGQLVQLLSTESGDEERIADDAGNEAGIDCRKESIGRPQYFFEQKSHR